MKTGEIKRGNICFYCENTYRKEDFNLCPNCGADAGNVTAKVWKPSKQTKKQYAKKMQSIK